MKLMWPHFKTLSLLYYIVKIRMKTVKNRGEMNMEKINVRVDVIFKIQLPF